MYYDFKHNTLILSDYNASRLDGRTHTGVIKTVSKGLEDHLLYVFGEDVVIPNGVRDVPHMTVLQVKQKDLDMLKVNHTVEAEDGLTIVVESNSDHYYETGAEKREVDTLVKYCRIKELEKYLNDIILMTENRHYLPDVFMSQADNVSVENTNGLEQNLT